MAINTNPQPTFICDTEGERNGSWPEGSIIFCKDTNKTYVIKSGGFVEASSGAMATHTSDYNHANIHASTLLGTKTVDEAGVGDNKALMYKTSSGKIEYTDLGGGTPHAIDSHTDANIVSPSSGQALVYDGANWDNTVLPSVITDHGGLGGLADDDHTHYLTSGRAGTWHSNLAGAHISSGDAHNHNGGDGGQISHSTLSALDYASAGHTGFSDSGHAHDYSSTYAPIAKGVIGGDAHAHINTSGAQIAHSSLSQLDYASAGHTGFSASGHNHTGVYAPEASGIAGGNAHDHAGGDGAQIDHGGLAGLGDDDHSIYLNTTRHDTTTRHSLGTVVPHDSLDGLSDVTIATPASGQSIKYNGSFWENAAGGGGASTLDDLTDVIIATPASGQALMYNGSTWKNDKVNAFTVINVKEWGAVGDGSADDTTAIQNAINSVGSIRGATIYFPAGVYKTTSTLTINHNSLAIRGCSRGGATIYPCTNNIYAFTLTSGNEYTTFKDLEIYAGVTMVSGGGAITTNGSHDVLMDNLTISGMYTGINVTGGSIKVTIMNTVISSTIATNGVCINIDNGLAGDTYIGPWVIMSHSPAAKPLAGIRVVESGHFCIQNANVTSCIYGLYICPASGKDVTYGFISESLFDSCGTAAVWINAPNQALAGRARSIKFTGSWMSGSNPTGEGYGICLQGASNGVIDDISFTSCRILNNGYHGVDYDFGTNVRFCDCTIAGNSQQTSNTYNGIDIAAAVSDFEITGCRIGMAGTATNTQKYAINIAAGASDRYSIIANDVGSNNTPPYINDGGTGVAKTISQNLPGMQAYCTGTTAATSGTGETLLYKALIPANSLRVGDCFRIRLVGTSSSTGTLTWRVRVGTLGTTSDAQAWASIASAAQAANETAGIDVLLVVKTLGASGTAYVNGHAHAAAVLQKTAVGAAADVTINTTAALYIDVDCTCSVGIFTGRLCAIESVK